MKQVFPALTVLYVIAVALNFAWEMAQAPLYGPMGTLVQASRRCFVASLGDGVLMLGVVLIGYVVFGTPDVVRTTLPNADRVRGDCRCRSCSRRGTVGAPDAAMELSAVDALVAWNENWSRPPGADGFFGAVDAGAHRWSNRPEGRKLIQIDTQNWRGRERAAAFGVGRPVAASAPWFDSRVVIEGA